MDCFAALAMTETDTFAVMTGQDYRPLSPLMDTITAKLGWRGTA
jgi:hypothetical protein